MTLPHPLLPEALDGFTILHLTDLHIRRDRPWASLHQRLVDLLPTLPVDLVCFTGDAMNYPGDETAALRGTHQVLASAVSRLGVVGVFGNHDSVQFRSMAAGLTSVRWLRDEILHFPEVPLTVIGPEDPEDFLATLLSAPQECPAGDRPAPDSGRFRLALTHYPTEIYPAATFGVHLLLAGHTHGGQLRLSPDIAPHTSTDLPGNLACGVLRLGTTLACVPRGLGQAVVDLRLFCPPQAPIYILRKGPFEGPDPGSPCPTLTRLVAW